MCIEYSRGTLPESITAEEDKIVYKVVIVDDQQRLVPPFASQLYGVKDFFYELNVLKENELLLGEAHGFPVVKIGMFTFEDYVGAMDFMANNSFYDGKYRSHMYKGIVPKGAQYYVGGWDGSAVNVIASDKLILTELIASCYDREWERHPELHP